MLRRAPPRLAARLAPALLTALLVACASSPRPAPAPVTHRPAPRPQPTAPRPAHPTPPTTVRPLPAATPAPRPAPALSFSDLPGWATEDHLEVFRVYRGACSVAIDAAARTVCDRARRSDIADEAAARAFLQDNFTPVEIRGEGTLTAYFTPEYPARHAPDGEFSAPVRPRPPAAALMVVTPNAPPPAPAAAPSAASGEDATAAAAAAAALGVPPSAIAPAQPPPPISMTPPPHPATRAEIEAWPSDTALAWMRAEDLFFMQIQGSGVLDFPGGERLRAITVATNGLPFVGIAKPMRERGLLKDNQTSGDAIRTWLAAHRGAEADGIMRLNTRYGFFALEPYDGTGVSGAAGLRLAPRRAIAVERNAHALGGLYWISADAPALTGAFPSYRRAVMALDIGGAIKGAVRADLYAGVGEAAGREAGRVRHRLKLFELQPRP